jgi:hypothetical protein
MRPVPPITTIFIIVSFILDESANVHTLTFVMAP